MRNDGSYLRTTWHADRRVFVVSTWNDEVCTAAVRVPVEEAAELVGLLVDGLAEATNAPAEDRTAPANQVRAHDRALLTLRRDLQAWVRHARRRLGALISGSEQGDQPPEPPAATPPTSEPPEPVRWIA